MPTDIPTELSSLRNKIKQSSSIAEVAREVDMERAWLSRVLSPKTQDKLTEVRRVVEDL